MRACYFLSLHKDHVQNTNCMCESSLVIVDLKIFYLTKNQSSSHVLKVNRQELNHIYV